jgi:hypothetical protein
MFLSDAVKANEHPLLVGVRLAETRFNGWRYGHREYRRQVNCVQFMVAVVEELLQRELTPEERSGILINRVGRRWRLPRLVQNDDPRIRGIQTALVQMGKGVIVKPSDAKPGDFIQYWKKRNGRWIGHASIIADVIRRETTTCALVFGSHQSLGGIGIGEFEVGLNDPEVKVYVVRFKS